MSDTPPGTRRPSPPTPAIVPHASCFDCMFVDSRLLLHFSQRTYLLITVGFEEVCQRFAPSAPALLRGTDFPFDPRPPHNPWLPWFAALLDPRKSAVAFAFSANRYLFPP